MNFRNTKCLALAGVISGIVLLATVPGSSQAQSSWKAPPDADGYSNPLPATTASVAAGKAVYQKYCVLCHGEQGMGNGPSARMLEPKPANFTDKVRMNQTDGSLAWKIVTGRGPMPSWEPVLTEDEIWNVINYVRTFAK